MTARSMLLGKFDEEGCRGQKLVTTFTSRNLRHTLARFTSKRRSPWLCPAPSVGAGSFFILFAA
jgi:hypothetical protein